MGRTKVKNKGVSLSDIHQTTTMGLHNTKMFVTMKTYKNTNCSFSIIYLVTRTYFELLPRLFLISATTAAVTSLVVAFPPRSCVRTPEAVTFSTHSINFVEASSSPSQASISAAVQKVATGLATPLPVMSNAEPWMGSNIDGFSRLGSRLLVGAMPIEPARAAAKSERISAC